MGISIRPTGLDHAAAALQNLERRQDVIANNLANVSTAGFKGERTFTEMLAGTGVPVMRSATDLRAGALTSTGGPLDVANAGEGFFVVDTPHGERLTRGGAFQLDSSGRIVDASGQPVLGEGGVAITIPEKSRNIVIDRTGSVIVDGTHIGRFRIESVAPGQLLEHEGDSLFRAPGAHESVPNEQRAIRQGAVEDSNTDSLGSLVDLIAVQRAYASVQKVMTTIDGARGTSATEIGRPA